MNILLIGSGGREHALAWKIRQSPLCEKLFVVPGNAGTVAMSDFVPLNPDNMDEVARVCRDKKIGLVVVGPEAPLVEGIRDYLAAQPGLEGLLIVGPGKSGARLEGSKDFSKQFMTRHGIPTAKAKTFTEPELMGGLAYLDQCTLPIVLKADGLAAGKGVIICTDHNEAKATLRDMLANHRFGNASACVLIEEFLSGIELSVFVLTDGKDYVLLPEAKDYKRIGEQDQGPNTGGMGAVSPVPFARPAFMDKVVKRIIEPTLKGLQSEGIPYKGFIFFGLINVNGEPFVIEYNARMGDPETEVVIPRITSDLVELLIACAQGALKRKKVTVTSQSAVTVMLVSGGYPGNYEKGKVISGLDTATEGLLFHAATQVMRGGGVATSGGRVISVTGLGNSLEDARVRAYNAVNSISFDKVYYRRDIGVDLLEVGRSRP